MTNGKTESILDITDCAVFANGFVPRLNFRREQPVRTILTALLHAELTTIRKEKAEDIHNEAGVRCFGLLDIRTPRLDSESAHGMEFICFYVRLV